MINLADIVTGDQVIIQDQQGNVAGGVVEVGDRTQTVAAFDGITYAKRPSPNHAWKKHPTMRVVGHTPAMFGAEQGTL